MKLVATNTDTTIEDPDDEAILRAVLSVVDDHDHGRTVCLELDGEEAGDLLCVEAYFDDDDWHLFLGRRDADDATKVTTWTADKRVSSLCVAEIFQQHAKGDESWLDEFHWGPVKTISLTKLLAVLAGVVVAVVLIWICLAQ